MQKPICLISSSSAGEIQVDREALDVLNSIRQHVVVVSIVGMYRTGKSYLMNRLAGKHTGFPLGSTVQSETKGIWMWCVPHPHKDDQTLVLLDTEGLGDVAKGDQAHDTWIFSLAVLLSSTFAYNSMGTINNEAVMSLHYVTELTEHIKVKSSKEKEDVTAEKFIHFFPTFVWAVRDFTLELRIDGEAVTADEYLENSLKLVKGNSKHAAYSNGPRECIRNYFPTRKCFVFDQPASKEKLRVIEELTDADLEPAFVRQTLEFCSYIFKHSKEKTMTGGYKVTGQMLGNLAVTYVDAIRSGSVPCLENAVAALSQIENSAAVEESFALYRQLLGERVKLHTETQEELSSAHEGCLKEALQLFMNRSFKDEDQSFQRHLMGRIKDEYDGKCSENAVLSQSHCTALLQQLWSQMDYESFMRPGGYADYRVQLDSIVQTYRDTPGKGVQAEQALEIVMKEKNDLGASILKADRNLTEQDRKLKEEEARVKMERFKAEVARRNQEDAMKRLEDAEKAHRKNEQQLMDKLERERRAIIEENQRVLDQRLQEQRALISELFEQRARMMEAQVQSLQRELAASKSREEEARMEMERFKAEVARREQEDAVKRLEDAEKAHRVNEQQPMDKLERERRAIAEQNQRVIDQCLKVSQLTQMCFENAGEFSG
ncbi:guanylate-binding protein 1-like isoform X3 [Anguilla anguilla]|nr:guanylate-binding protein 1-like isoform X3 [Anguilla anguilla]